MFDALSFTAELRENQPVGSFVIALSAESQSTLTYDIVNDGKFFLLLVHCPVQRYLLSQ